MLRITDNKSVCNPAPHRAYSAAHLLFGLLTSPYRLTCTVYNVQDILSHHPQPLRNPQPPPLVSNGKYTAGNHCAHPCCAINTLVATQCEYKSGLAGRERGGGRSHEWRRGSRCGSGSSGSRGGNAGKGQDGGREEEEEGEEVVRISNVGAEWRGCGGIESGIRRKRRRVQYNG